MSYDCTDLADDLVTALNAAGYSFHTADDDSQPADPHWFCWSNGGADTESGPSVDDPNRAVLSAVGHLAERASTAEREAACYRDELVTLHAAALALVRKLQSMPGIHASHYAELAGLLDAA